MYNIHTPQKSTCAIWEAAIYKEKESYYYLPLIPSLPLWQVKIGHGITQIHTAPKELLIHALKYSFANNKAL